MAYKKRTTSKRAKLKKQRKTDNEYIKDLITVAGLIQDKPDIIGSEIQRITGLSNKRFTVIILTLMETGLIEPIED